jgi:curli biogenesis system outer membrane secretion channel CsgG/copper chaperone CopZ
MKNLFTLIALFVFSFATQPLSAQKLKKEDIKNICNNTVQDERPRITVSGFKLGNHRSRQALGQELASMLTNALRSTGCFNVLETVAQLGDEMEEIGFNYGGATNGSGPQAGKMLSSQLVLTGEITEFDEDYIHILGVGNDRVHLGFILKVVDIQTREIIWSQSFEQKSSKPQIKVLNTDIAAFGNKATEDAAEKAIIEATYAIAQQKNLFSKYQNNPSDTNHQVFDRNNCPLVQQVNPSVMVIIPEVHIARRVPDPAGETEIIKQLIAAGYRVIDPSVYASLRNSNKLEVALHDVNAARAMGQEFGADIIIIGEAFSESAGTQHGMFSCRARVEARAVNTNNAQILAADGAHAGGLDNTELTAGKVALRNAGSEMANYFINALCQANLGGNVKGINGGTSFASSKLELVNTNFMSLSKIEKFLQGYDGITSVSKSMSGKTANLDVNHSCTLDEIAMALSEGKAGVKVEITGFDTGKITMVVQ